MDRSFDAYATEQPRARYRSLHEARPRDAEILPPTRLAQAIEQSPRLLAQRQLKQAIQSSTRMTAQRRRASEVEHSPRMLAQRVDPTEQRAPHGGGLPAQLKHGIERLSGVSMDRVTVHYNSSKPTQLQALAYAQGTQIYLGPGQQKHLPHEAWHVVQQQQGRVQPTVQAQGVAINNDARLEREADLMGARAMQTGLAAPPSWAPRTTQYPTRQVMQAFWLRRNGELDWINHANQVDAVLHKITPEEQQRQDAEQQTANTPASEMASSIDTQQTTFGQTEVYRLADDIQVSWREIQRLISALGAAKVQAIYLHDSAAWGNASGIAEIRAHLANFAKLDLRVLTTLFSRPTEEVAGFLQRTDSTTFGRIFRGDRAAQIDLLESGRYREITPADLLDESAAPLATPNAATESATTSVTAVDGEAAPSTAPAPSRATAIREAVAYYVSTKPAAGKSDWLESLAANQAAKWSAARIAENIHAADADTKRGAAVLSSLALPGVAGPGIFSGVVENVTNAITHGPYQTAKIKVKLRPAVAVLRGQYTGLGDQEPSRIDGSFDGNVSGATQDAARPLALASFSGDGKARATVHAKLDAHHQLQGQVRADLAFGDAYAYLKDGVASFAGGGTIHTAMDAPLRAADTHWQADRRGRAKVSIERQIASDGAGNRTVLNALEFTSAQAQANASLDFSMQGSSTGWGHAVRNAGRYANLSLRIRPKNNLVAPGVFRPDNLHQIVRHAGITGLPLRYTREADGDGPEQFEGPLLAPELTLSGTLEALRMANMLPVSIASLLTNKIGLSRPVAKDSTTAKDIQYFTTPKVGTPYSTVLDRKKYEFTLKNLNPQPGWSGAHFSIRYVLGELSFAHYQARQGDKAD